MKIEDKLFLNKYKVDNQPHLRIKDPSKCLQCEEKQCTLVCPAAVYKWDENMQRIIVGWENCMEMGACTIACNEFDNIEMQYPKGGYGITYRYG